MLTLPTDWTAVTACVLVSQGHVSLHNGLWHVRLAHIVSKKHLVQNIVQSDIYHTKCFTHFKTLYVKYEFLSTESGPFNCLFWTLFDMFTFFKKRAEFVTATVKISLRLKNDQCNLLQKNCLTVIIQQCLIQCF